MSQQRKLIKLGNSSFAIALPKDWVEKAGLNKGDSIFITPNSNGELIIQPKFKKANGGDKEVVIQLKEKGEDEIARDLISAYTSGNGIISVVGKKEKIRIAKQKVKNFLNLELIEISEDKAVFKDLLDIENIEIKNFIRRMDNNLREMFSLIFEICKDRKNSKNKIKELDEIDKDITKFYFLVWRLMNIGIDNPSVQSNLKLGPKSFVVFFWISYNLEQMGDELKRIARILGKCESCPSQVLDSLKLVEENYIDSMKSFFDENRELAKKVIFKKPQINKACDKLSDIEDCEIVSEKIKKLNEKLHHNAKMMFYNL